MTSVALALRLGRWGIVGFGLAALVSTGINTIAFYAVAGNTPQERVTFGNSMLALASQLVAILPPPIRPDTAAGYVEFRGFHALAILFAVWALASATGAARGDEERGIVEALLATGTGRVALLGSRLAAFAIGLGIASGAAAAGFAAGVAGHHESINTLGLVEECALLAALALACYAIALLVAQVTPARAAAAAAGVLLLGLYLLNSLSRVFDSLATWRWLSPFRYYDLSEPLTPGGPFDLRAFVVLVAVAVFAGATAALAFELRDVGRGLVATPSRMGPAVHEVTGEGWLRYPVVRDLYRDRLGILAWASGLALLAVVFAALTKTVVEVLRSLPVLHPYLPAAVQDQLYAGVLGVTWLSVAELLFAALAIVQVARWAAEDGDGRLEMSLSQPVSRASVVVERLTVLATEALLVAGVSGVTLYYASGAQGIDLDAGRLAAASFLLVPFALLFAAAGSLLASWNPRAAAGVLGAFAFASYLDTELGAIFKLPLWLQDMSAFKLVGTPLLTGIDGRNLALLLLLALAGVGTSILLMQRRDVGA